MRTPRNPETDEQRTVREARQAREREQRFLSENEALDAAVRRSIELYGA